MKYIRTKDGRIINTQDERGKLIGDNVVKVNNSLIVVKNNKGDELIPIEDIIKKADTIEELCDMFVCIRKDNSKALLSCVDEVLLLRMCYIGIYGAIWCEYGLKYVAKLNKKGQLQLCI